METQLHTAPDLTVLHRDERLIAVAKPAGMIVHRGLDNDPLTVLDIVRDRLIGRPVHGVHRLDRATSGVLLVALDAAAARSLSEAFASGRVRKRYLALVRGPFHEACVLDHAIPKSREKGALRVDAVTEFAPLAQQDRWTLVEARPRTGRLHQIRRHLKHLSCPIVGDVPYGKGDVNRHFRSTYGLHRLALHAWSLELDHPDGGRLTVTAPLPEDLAVPLAKLGVWPLQAEDART